jgi:hypothetical protein
MTTSRQTATTKAAHPAVGDIYRCGDGCGLRYRVTEVRPQDGWTEVTAVREDRLSSTITRASTWFRDRVINHPTT